jgi:hypothetical protein
VSEQPPDLRPHGDPLRPHPGAPDDGREEETAPSDLPAPEPVDGPDGSGDRDPGAGAD